jgi:ribosome maturation factor RimP
VRDELIALLEPPIRMMGFELVELECKLGGRQGLLRIYIDGPGGITLEHCEQVSKQVSGLLDVEDPIPGSYVLEVSSPGIDRPLRTEGHFRHFAGQRVRIELDAPLQGRKRYKGVLLGIEQGVVSVDLDGTVHELPFDRIVKARLAPEL